MRKKHVRFNFVNAVCLSVLGDLVIVTFPIIAKLNLVYIFVLFKYFITVDASRAHFAHL